ncbi:hypothetical protein GCM10020000_35910 [Streptomyces olivoverticillatus]
MGPALFERGSTAEFTSSQVTSCGAAVGTFLSVSVGVQVPSAGLLVADEEPLLLPLLPPEAGAAVGAAVPLPAALLPLLSSSFVTTTNTPSMTTKKMITALVMNRPPPSFPRSCPSFLSAICTPREGA